MTNLLDRRLALLAAAPARPLLGQGLRGIERETLRVTPTGQLATMNTTEPRHQLVTLMTER